MGALLPRLYSSIPHPPCKRMPVELPGCDLQSHALLGIRRLWMSLNYWPQEHQGGLCRFQLLSFAAAEPHEDAPRHAVLTSYNMRHWLIAKAAS